MSKNYNSTLQTNNTDLQAILNTINKLPNAGGEQATPVISVNNSNGLITATAGAKTSTHQLAFQAAKTITPGTTNQIAISSGYYTGGAITVKGDSNLVAGNIKSGVSIFGVNGNYAGSGGDTSMEDEFITRTLTTYTNDRVKTIGDYAFHSCINLTSVSFPAATTINDYAFHSCINLTSVSFPAATTIGSSAFFGCSKLTSVSFPAVTIINNNAFCYCFKLTSVSFPAATTISDCAFFGCQLTTASFPSAKIIGSSAFCDCSGLTTASFPAAIFIGSSAFDYCSSLTTANFPAATTINDYAFEACFKLTSVSFPVATTIGQGVFIKCQCLVSVTLPAVTTIGSSAFRGCYNLKSLYLTGSSVCDLKHSSAFYSTPIGGYSTSAGTYGSIYVKTSLLASYKAATNWAYFSSRFVGI